uniref:Uncharacterized protein MANES_05G168900 n=1 Tax=Rhizophora mucronata TaxID=61149 RepID=A0A2P2JMY8_RHIMU
MEKQNQAELVDARRPCFFELFSSNLSTHRLKIPVKFIKHLEGRTSGSVSLIGPSGNVWPVKLIQQNDQLILDRGWPTFVQDHLIECGDLLVFRYDGHLCFTVLVFDPSACEKDSAFHSKCSEDLSRFCASVGHKREREEKDEEASSSDYKFDSMPKKAKGRCFDFLSDRVGTKQKVGLAINDNGGCQHNDENMNKRCQDAGFHYEASQCRSLPGCPVTPSELKSCSEKPEPAVEGRNGNKDETNLSERGPISTFSEREKEKRVAQSFISCYPYFVRIMKKFNISGSYTLNIPYQFSMAHLPDCRTEIVLRTVKGACWTVNSIPTTRVHTSHTFCGGWMAFVRNNDIKMGDICIFELVREFEMRVFILRVGKDSPEKQIAKSAPLNIATAAMSHKIEVCQKKSRRKVLSKIIKKADASTKRASKKRTRKHDNAIKGLANAVPCSWSRTGNEKQGNGSDDIVLLLLL